MPIEFQHPPPPFPPLPEPQSQIDVRKRYDIYCTELYRGVVVFRNALFKGASSLLPGSDPRGRIVHHDFVELEQANGQTVYLSRSSIFRFCEPGIVVQAEVITQAKQDA